MKIDPKALQLFLAVCRAGTFSGAARAEHISQPSVSVAIQQLEHRLDTRLCERHRQGIQLTIAGKALQQRAEAMEHLLEAAQEEVRLVGMNLAGPLVIGGTPGALATLVPKAVASLKEEYPQFELRILERPETELHELLRNYEIDLAVVTAGVREYSEEFVEYPLITDPFSLIVGHANEHLPKEASLADMSNARWVLPEAVGGFRRQIDALFITTQTPIPHNVIHSDSLLTTKAIVRYTDYVTILPREVVAVELSTGVLRAVQIKEEAFQRQVGILTLAERAPTLLAGAFIEHARHLANL